MKKLYTLALAAVLALSAAANTKQAVEFMRRGVQATPAVSAQTGKSLPADNAMRKAPAKAAPVADAAALNVWSAYGHLTGQGSVAEYDLAVEVLNAATGTLTVELGKAFKLSATYNASTGKLSIPTNQLLGQDADGDIRFYVKSFDASGNIADGAADVAAVEGTLVNGVVTFDPDQVWALGDPTNEAVGFYSLTSENTFYTIKMTSLGMGSFVENLVYPIYVGSENTEAAQVEVVTDGKGTYIIKDAFKAMFAALNANMISPDLTLDASDPNNILIPVSYVGVNTEEYGSMYIYSESWFYDSYLGGIGFDPSLAITMKVEDEQATITFPVDCTTIMGNASTDYFPGSPYVSTLTFSLSNAGVTNVAAVSDAPAVYYNLQGTPVENPSAGLYLRRQGATVTKVMVK